eukprot:SAG11_NODE_1988_length_3961_cov_2.373900_6_plen_126_part_00
MDTHRIVDGIGLEIICMPAQRVRWPAAAGACPAMPATAAEMHISTAAALYPSLLCLDLGSQSLGNYKPAAVDKDFQFIEFRGWPRGRGKIVHRASGGKARRIKFKKNGTPKSVFFKDEFSVKKIK